MVQKLSISIYDQDKENGSLQEQTLMGKTREFLLSEVVCARDGKLELNLQLNGKENDRGKVLLFLEKNKSQNQ